jgi:hypothetical protein
MNMPIILIEPYITLNIKLSGKIVFFCGGLYDNIAVGRHDGIEVGRLVG